MNADQISNKSRVSRAVIRETVKKLITELDPSVPLTVTMIAKEAKMNRATFYYHYDTLEALFLDILEDFLMNLEKVIDQYGSKLTGAILSHTLTGWMKKNQAFCSNFIHLYPLFTYSEIRKGWSNGFFRITARRMKSKIEPPPSLLLFFSGIIVATIDDLGQKEKPVDFLTLEGRMSYGFDLVWERLGKDPK